MFTPESAVSFLLHALKTKELSAKAKFFKFLREIFVRLPLIALSNLVEGDMKNINGTTFPL